MKKIKKCDNTTGGKIKKIVNKKKNTAAFACTICRRYLTDIFLNNVNISKESIAYLTRITHVCRGTFGNIKQDKLPSLSTLHSLFSAPFPYPILTAEQACTAINLLIAESIPHTDNTPTLHIAHNAQWHANVETAHPLSAYMAHLRTHYLKWPARKILREFEYCDMSQLHKIETDCCGVGEGAICHLFYNYLTTCPELTNEKWDIFATLLLRKLFPKMKDVYLVES